MDETDKKEIEEMFRHHVGIPTESFQHKLDILVEGHMMLNEKIDRIADDLAAHRADTESHGECGG